MKNKFLLFLAISVTGCSRTEPVPRQVPEALTFSISADMPTTKTALAENGDGTYSLNWNSGDKIGLYIDGRQQNSRMEYAGGLFFGSLIPGKEAAEKAEYRAYYPYSSTFAGETVSSEIANVQNVPFDGTSDFMYTDVVEAPYDERDMPEDMHLSFTHHLFGIVEINVVNTDESLAGEKLVSVTLTSGTAVLSGAYSFDLSRPDAAPEFSADGSHRNVTAVYRDAETLGTGTWHKIYLVVNPFENVDDLVLSVKTSGYTVEKQVDRSLTLSAGKVTVFPEVTLSASDTKVKRKKVLSYFGDSIACKYLQDDLKSLLGEGWEVYMNGIPGAGDLNVAAMLGCVGMTFRNSFTLPASSDEKVECGQICAVEDIDGTGGMYNVLSTYWFNDHLVLNPITVYTDEDAVGIECELSCVYDPADSPNAKYYLRRVHSSGKATEIAAGTSVVKTYQAMHLRDADVLCIYTGTNNTFTESNYPSVVKIHERMRDFMTGPAKEDYVICGFHTNRYVEKHVMWTKAYADALEEAFGEHVLDYKLLGLDIPSGHVPVPSGYGREVAFTNTDSMTAAEKNGYYDRALELSKAVGAVTGNDFDEKDEANVSVLEWPASWWSDYDTNVHPNSKGYDVMAHLVYEKMKSLGYLN